MQERGKTTAAETDAFSRKWRHLLRWAPGELKKLKRAYAKRMRRKPVERPE